jgi:hypothetical protein
LESWREPFVRRLRLRAPTIVRLSKGHIVHTARLQLEYVTYLHFPYTKPSSKLSDLIIFAFYYRLFDVLGSEKSSAVPYSRDAANNRRKYGDNMPKKGEMHLTTQQQYEGELKAKIDAARQKRQEERGRLEALEVIFLILFSRNNLYNSINSARGWGMEDLRKQAEVLVEERRLARVQTLEWSREAQMESDEERERKSKKMLGKGREWQWGQSL